MSLNIHELFEAMAETDQVKEATRAKSEQLAEAMEMRWPGVNDVAESQKEFLEGNSESMIQVTESTISNRPTHVVVVRHPGAVAAQAKYSFVTKAVKDVS